MNLLKTLRRALLAALAALLLATLPSPALPAARALEVAGQTLPDTATVAGRQLLLNGAGKRVKYLVADVYVAALYTTAKTTDPDAIITSTAPRRVELRMLRTVAASTMLEAFNEGMTANTTADAMKQYAPQIAALAKIFDDAKSASKGDIIQIDFLPTQGTLLTIRGKTHPAIEGDAFASAMLSIWLGKNPAQDSLKTKLLGN